MLSNATNQQKSAVELGYMCPRGISTPPAILIFRVYVTKETYERNSGLADAFGRDRNPVNLDSGILKLYCIRICLNH